MSLVLEALGKVKQQSDMARAGADPAQIQIMTGGMPAPGPGSSASGRAGVLIGSAVGVAGVMLALAVVVVGYMFKPPPQSAAAAAPQPPMIAATQTASGESGDQTQKTIRGVEASPPPQGAILAVQPFLNDLMEATPAARVEDATVAIVQTPVTVEVKPTVEDAKPQAAEVAPAAQPAPLPAAPPAPPAPPKPALQPGLEYVQTLDVADAPLVKLGAIVWSDTLKVALVNGATMQTGDGIQGVRLVEIEPKRVKLEHDGRQFWLRLP